MSLNEIICIDDDSGEAIAVLAARLEFVLFYIKVSGNPKEFDFEVIVVL
jgi:hypothetical protein